MKISIDEAELCRALAVRLCDEDYEDPAAHAVEQVAAMMRRYDARQSYPRERIQKVIRFGADS